MIQIGFKVRFYFHSEFKDIRDFFVHSQNEIRLVCNIGTAFRMLSHIAFSINYKLIRAVAGALHLNVITGGNQLQTTVLIFHRVTNRSALGVTAMNKSIKLSHIATELVAAVGNAPDSVSSQATIAFIFCCGGTG